MSAFFTKPDMLVPLDLAVFPSALGKNSPQTTKIRHPFWKQGDKFTKQCGGILYY